MTPLNRHSGEPRIRVRGRRRTPGFSESSGRPKNPLRLLLILFGVACMFVNSRTPCYSSYEPLDRSVNADSSLHCKPTFKREPTTGRAGRPNARYQLQERYVQVLRAEKRTRRLDGYLKRTRESAERGEAEGQYRLGLSYDVGRLVSRNHEEAAKWYKKAADQGHPKAQVYLGLAYEYGQGVTKDLEQAANWYLKSAELGFPRGQYRAGRMYDLGFGVAKDRAQAVKWYEKAAAQGNKAAHRRLARLGVTVTHRSVRKRRDKRPQAVRQDRSRRSTRRDMRRGWNVEPIQKRAEEGDENSQYRLGLLYEKGYLGLARDTDDAAKWYRKAAEQGHRIAKLRLTRLEAKLDSTRDRVNRETEKPLEKSDFWEVLQRYEEAAEKGDVSAQYQLGRLYENASDEDQDYKQAAKWYRRAAGKGHAESQFSLGWMYEQGKGVEKDYREAFKWYSAAAEKGYSAAHTGLGLMYEVGKGVPKNLEESIKRYSKAAEKGNKRAQKRLAMLGKGTEPDAQKGDSEASRKRVEQQARAGSAEARHKLGHVYYFGRGVDRNLKEAAGLYTKAAEKGLADSQYMLGHMYENGLGVDKDPGLAIKWYKRAAKKGHAQAQTRLGTKYQRGEGVSRNYKEAIGWYTRAAQNNDPIAQASLGLLCEVGRGLSRDYAAAVKWYTKAAEKGHADVQFLLARMYETGRGAPKDEKAAVKWFKESAERGYASARDHLRKINDTRKAEKAAAVRRPRSRDGRDGTDRTREYRDRRRELSKRMASRLEAYFERLEEKGGDMKTLEKWERRLQSRSDRFEKADLERLMARLHQLKARAGKSSEKPATIGSPEK